MSSAGEVKRLLESLGVDESRVYGGTLCVRSPVDGSEIARVVVSEAREVASGIGRARDAFLVWRAVPAPERGELVRLLAEELRRVQADLGRLVSIETGKILSEGLGEVREMTDICEFAVGLSRQLYGLTIASERRGHRMMEVWHPFGVTGVISAFNFPVAVWCWNAALAIVCGNSVVWKPSEKSPLTALACQAVFERACERFGLTPPGLLEVVPGGPDTGEALVGDPRIPLISATGSTAMGRQVAPKLAERFARAILELGGNNAGIVCASADLDLALRAITFAAIGTAGQRCTSMRRLFVHDDVYDRIVPRLKQVFGSVSVGNPLDAGSLVGPLIDSSAYEKMQEALRAARVAGGIVHGGFRLAENVFPDAYYVRPALVEMAEQTGPVLEETFAPILYVMRFSEFEKAIELHNGVAAGLSSSIFTLDLREAEQFLSMSGSDCGICNVNIGTSGAEIGGAFGGEKETGGGREAGSDAWKGYMRRATGTVNYSRDLPFAQGVEFDLANFV